MTYTSAKGTTFNLGDFGPDGQYNRYVGWYNPFDGQLGETFKVVLSARTKKALNALMEAHG
jgi:hypothetical protein